MKKESPTQLTEALRQISHTSDEAKALRVFRRLTGRRLDRPHRQRKGKHRLDRTVKCDD